MPRNVTKGPAVKGIKTVFVEGDHSEMSDLQRDPRSFLKKAGAKLPEGAKLEVRIFSEEQ